MRPLRAAVIGAGYFGNLHAAKYAELDDTRLVGVCDIDPERAETVAAAHGAAPVLDFRELSEVVDCVSVVVPTRAHHRVAKHFLERGVHVLLEKPISSTLAEADDLIGTAEGSGAVLQVGHLERFNPAVRALDGLVSEPRFIECLRTSPFRQRGTDINVVLDMMVHDIDLILSIVRAPVDWIDAIGVPVLSEVEDIANVRVRFSNGCVANITANRVSGRTERTMRIFQPDTYIHVDLGHSRVSVTRRVINGSAVPELKRIEREVRPADNLKSEIADFVRVVRSGGTPLVTGADGRRALEVALDISRQLQWWQPTVPAAEDWLPRAGAARL